MNFGIGLNDVIVITKFAWDLYKACRESSDDFKRLSAEVGSLHVVLRETEDYLHDHPELDAERRRRLVFLLDACRLTLDDLQRLLLNYESLGTNQQRTWDRMRWGLTDVSDLRSRLISNATLLGAFTSSLANSSTTRMEKRLAKFMTEVRAGLREGSVVTAPDVTETIDTPDVWGQLRRELEDVGISHAVIDENREYIKAWFKTALQDGLMDEDNPAAAAAAAATTGNDDSSLLMPTPSSSSSMPAMIGMTTPDASDPSFRVTPPAPSDSGYGGSVRMDSVSSMTSANGDFETELRRRHTDREVDEALRSLSLSPSATTASASSSSAAAAARMPPGGGAVAVRKKSSPARMLMKFLQKDDAIIQAASDGDIKKVARLISVGVDVNAKDRWGWSALSMCGYGGYTDIARLLLEHGADLDNIDVDGESPEDLARNRGNREMVILFDEERKARDLRAREMDSEKPRKVGS